MEEALCEIIEGFKSTGQVMTGKRVYKIKVRGLGNECNLSCYMCAPQNSTSRTTEMLKLSDKSRELFFPGAGEKRAKEILTYNKTISKNNDKTKNQLLDVIEEIKPQLSQLNLSGGEPFMIE
jgi:organic radical activating enzyme